MITGVYVNQYISNGLLRIADALENVMKLIRHFLKKVQMLTLVNVTKDINGRHLFAVFHAEDTLILVTLMEINVSASLIVFS